MKEFVIPYAETMVDGRPYLVSPRTAQHGQGHEYRCPECRELVSFRHETKNDDGLVTRSRHFAHKGDQVGRPSCSRGTGESEQHRQAKQLVGQAIADWTAERAERPIFVHTCDTCGTTKREPLTGADKIWVDEQVQDAGIGILRPDVVVRHGDAFGAIEIRHAHAIDRAKIRAYDALSWWVEIDAASVRSGKPHWLTYRASWLGSCAECDARAKRGPAVAFDDSLEAWERRALATCGGCGMRTLDEHGICRLCGADKAVPRSPFVYNKPAVA